MSAAPVAAAALAKGALRRLAQSASEPTPENYARAYAEEAGQPPSPADSGAADAREQGAAWAQLVERLARNLDRGGKQWTGARRKESLKRVLDGSRSDATRLLQRLQSLLTAWETDHPADPAQTGAEDPPLEAMARAADDTLWQPLAAALHGTLQVALPPAEARAAALADELARLGAALAEGGVTAPHLAATQAACDDARRLLGQRHRLVADLERLCHELGAGLTELAEDDSWARGQCASLQTRLADGLSARGVRAAAVLLAETRQHHRQVRGERRAAQEALKQLLHDMLRDVGEIGEHTGRFELATARHAEAIAAADSLHGLAGVVKALLDDTRAVQSAVQSSQARLTADQRHAGELQARVSELEGELRRLSDEVSTDALTQVANRRGLAQAFGTEAARAARDAAAPLAVALIDIDNFKKLNDTLGHAAGDRALQALAAAVRERLRPGDHLARFGGEEFVVLLPATPLAEAQQALTRLQRALTEALFLHDGSEVFVTFSGGVTAWRAGEALEATLERADEALYEAKRSGKNRTCTA